MLNTISEKALNVIHVDGKHKTSNLRGKVPFFVDAKGKILHVGSDIENLLGYDAQTCLGKFAADYVVSPYTWLSLYLLLKENGVASDFHIHIKAKHGHRCPLILNIRAVSDDSGNTIGYEGEMFHSSESKVCELGLKDVASFANSSPYPVLRVSDEGQLLYANASSKDLLSVLNVNVGGSLSQGWQSWIRQVLRLRIAMTVDVHCDAYIYACAFVPVDGYVNIYCSDVTARKQLEEELRYEQQDLEERILMRTKELVRSNEKLKEALSKNRQVEQERQKLMLKMEHAQRLESLGVLAGGIAHDFNNLLAVMLGNSTLLKKKLKDYPEHQKYLKRIEDAGQSSADLCRQMLAYAGKGKVSMQKMSLSKMVEEIGHLMRSTISRSVQLEFRELDKLPLLKCDISQIRQVMMNLVINASESMGDQEGEIQLTTGKMDVDANYIMASLGYQEAMPGEYAYLEVADTGCGMDEDTLKRIFDPFFTTKFTGRGLGMSAILGIIQSHQGLIHVCSQPDCGTTFRVLLPLPEETSKQEVATAEPRFDEAAESTGTVLVVDDEENIREMICNMLQDIGYNTLEACDGEEAIQIFTQKHGIIASIILDVTMPKMGGDRAMKYIRAIRKDTPVIVTSGHAAEDMQTLFKDFDVAQFIQKPYEPKALENVVRQVSLVHS